MREERRQRKMKEPAAKDANLCLLKVLRANEFQGLVNVLDQELKEARNLIRTRGLGLGGKLTGFCEGVRVGGAEAEEGGERGGR